MMTTKQLSGLFSSEWNETTSHRFRGAFIQPQGALYLNSGHTLSFLTDPCWQDKRSNVSG